MRRFAGLLGLLVLLAAPAGAQLLFVGLEGSSPPTKTTDLNGFPNVHWTNHYAFDVNGAAATPDGTIYVCNGDFTSMLYKFPLVGSPIYQCTISVDIQGMGYGNRTLYGYSNFASPRGIYTIAPATGQATLVVDLGATDFRFFALDFNAVDGLLYGYTEYGSPSGLYSIDPTSGVLRFVTGPIPATNTQGRGLAVGNNTVYLTATRGDDSVPLYAFDLATGTQWIPFNNPYPQYHSTGGATWIPPSVDGVPDRSGFGVPTSRIELVMPSPARRGTQVRWRLAGCGPVFLDVVDAAGRQVARLEEGPQQAGLHFSPWSGRDTQGQPVPSGVYFVRLAVDGSVSSQPLILIR